MKRSEIKQAAIEFLIGFLFTLFMGYLLMPELFTAEANADFESRPNQVESILYPEASFSEEEIVLAKMVYGEARGLCKMEQAATVWCVMNRVESDSFPDGIVEVVTQKGQFYGYKSKNPIDPEIMRLVKDVLARHEMEGFAVGEVGRVLPNDFLYFVGDGEHNLFTRRWQGDDHWNWSLPNPYK